MRYLPRIHDDALMIPFPPKSNKFASSVSDNIELTDPEFFFVNSSSFCSAGFAAKNAFDTSQGQLGMADE